MLHRRKLLESNNHTGEEMGEANTPLRHDYEDAFVQALEDVYQDNKLLPFREFVQKWARRAGWLEQFVNLLKVDADFSWYTVYTMTRELRRMQPRWEYAANKLLQLGVPKDQIPAGQE